MKFLPGIFMVFGCLCLQLPAQTTDFFNNASDSLLTTNTNPESSVDYDHRRINNLFQTDTLNHLMISRLAVRGMQNYLLLMPGVQEQDGHLSIRGGSDQAIGYFVGGTMIMNNMADGPPVYIIPDALSLVQVFAGGHSARYGLAASGMVFSDLKQGRGNLNIGLNMQTDKLAGEGESFLGTYSYQDRIIVATLSGSTWDDRFRFFAAGENLQSGDWVKRFSSGFTFNNLVDANPRSQDVVDGNPDTVSISYPDGFTTGNSLDHLAFNTRLDVGFDNIHVKLVGMYLGQKRYELDTPILDILNSRKFYFERKNTFLSGTLSHVVSDELNYNISATFYDNNNEKFDDYFGNNWHAWSDSALISQHTNGAVNYRSRWRPQYDYELLGFPFSRDGDLTNRYIKEMQESWSVEALMNINLIKNNRISAGFYWMRGAARRYDVSSYVMSEWEKYDFTEDIPVFEFAEYLGSTYGYDMFGNEIDDGLNGPLEQQIFSAYAEDYIESGRLRFQLGARMDYLKDNRRYLRDPLNPIIDPETMSIAESEWIAKEGEWNFSPRIAVRYTINNNIFAGLSYARFVQSSLTVSPGMQEPLASRLYEANIKYIHRLFDLNVNAFSKYLNGYQRVTQTADYYRIDNSGFATIRGLEFSFTLHRTNRFQAWLNYTLIAAEGTKSDNGLIYYGAVYRGTQAPAITAPLDFVQNKRGSLILDYRFDAGDGGSLLERSGVNFVFNFNSGHPYTKTYAPPGGQSDPYTAGVDYMIDPRSREARETLNSSLTPWNYYLNLRLDKSFDLFRTLSATVYIRVLNLLNTRNVVNVYPNTGKADDDGYISDPQRYATAVNAYGPQYLDLYRAVNIENSQSYWDQIGLQMYGYPRQIFLGIELVY